MYDVTRMSKNIHYLHDAIYIMINISISNEVLSKIVGIFLWRSSIVYETRPTVHVTWNNDLNPVNYVLI